MFIWVGVQANVALCFECHLVGYRAGFGGMLTSAELWSERWSTPLNHTHA